MENFRLLRGVLVTGHYRRFQTLFSCLGCGNGEEGSSFSGDSAECESGRTMPLTPERDSFIRPATVGVDTPPLFENSIGSPPNEKLFRKTSSVMGFCGFGREE
ncbi:hypothetical protein NPIL_290361 [Nephila pilipes]|uniref:Uncharacterized protein n=1 Tax=Nephila pilipes TaxID=299642 RepID=A0A8X6QC46_NEPPI|nr:hypothetical protein NPIL_290361 [Nephila pilipes]